MIAFENFENIAGQMVSSHGSLDNGMKIQHFDDYEQQQLNRPNGPHELEPVIEEEYIQDEDMDQNPEHGGHGQDKNDENHLAPSMSDVLQKPIYSNPSHQQDGNALGDLSASLEDGKYFHDKRKKSAENTSTIQKPPSQQQRRQSASSPMDQRKS